MSRYYKVLAGLTLLAVQGCNDQDNHQVITGNVSNSAINKELEAGAGEAVNCLNIDLGVSSEVLSERVAAKKKTPEFLLLKRAHLPQNATLCQRRDFVDTILYLSNNQNRYSETDPQVQMIASAISGFEEEFIASARPNWHSANSYISDALMVILSKPEKKPFVKKHIDAYPWLMEVVVKNSWAIDFKDEVIAIAENKNGAVTYDFASAFVQLNDPTTEALINKCFVNSGGNRHIFYSRIKKLDWYDPMPAAQKIWMVTTSDLEREYLISDLVKSGFLPALEHLARHPKMNIYGDDFRRGLDLFNHATNQQLTAEAVGDWLAVSRGQLHYDTASQKFLIRGKGQAAKSNKLSAEQAAKFLTGANGTLPDGLKYRVISAGANRQSPALKKRVNIHYTMALPGQTPIDSSFKRGRPVLFPVSSTILGYQKAIYNMSVGDHWRLTIPPELAYGEAGLENHIPPNSTVEAEILLVEIIE